jgi:type II secretory pathway component PulL
VGVYEQGTSGCVRVLMDGGGRVLVGVASRCTWTDIVCLPQRVAQLAASERRKNTDGEWSRFSMVGYLSDAYQLDRRSWPLQSAARTPGVRQAVRHAIEALA